MLFPIYWMINVSLTQPENLRKDPPDLFPWNPTFAGYERVIADQLPYLATSFLVGIGTVILTWWLNHLSHKNDPPPQAVAAAEPAHFTFEGLFRDAGILLASLLPMLWPMLPRPWRRTVSPGTAGTVVTWIAPLLGRLFRRKPKVRTA